jgi:hypothetical protein
VIDPVYIRWLYVEILSEGKEFYLSKDRQVIIKVNGESYLWWGTIGCQDLGRYLLNKE